MVFLILLINLRTKLVARVTYILVKKTILWVYKFDENGDPNLHKIHMIPHRTQLQTVVVVVVVVGVMVVVGIDSGSGTSIGSSFSSTGSCR